MHTPHIKFFFAKLKHLWFGDEEELTEEQMRHIKKSDAEFHELTQQIVLQAAMQNTFASEIDHFESIPMSSEALDLLMCMALDGDIENFNNIGLPENGFKTHLSPKMLAFFMAKVNYFFWKRAIRPSLAQGKVVGIEMTEKTIKELKKEAKLLKKSELIKQVEASLSKDIKGLKKWEARYNSVISKYQEFDHPHVQRHTECHTHTYKKDGKNTVTHVHHHHGSGHV